MNENNEYHARLNIHVSDEQIKRIIDYHDSVVADAKIKNIDPYYRSPARCSRSGFLLEEKLEILLHIPRSVITDESLTKFLDDGIMDKIRFFKLPANYYIHWHIDYHGKGATSSINVPLHEMHDSVTLFNDGTDWDNALVSRSISRVNYIINSATLLNVRKFHSVYNMSPNVRYMMILRPNETVTYNDVLEYCKKNNLIDNIEL